MNGPILDFLFKLAAVLGGGSALVAALTYQRNARTKAAEFLLSLHKSFFVDPTYQPMKMLLDCDDAEDEAKLERVVLAESAEFTDFLNFFELVAYLTAIDTLSGEDMEALLGYYLNKLREKTVVWAYIKRSSNGFENLRRMLAERPGA